MSLGKVLVPTGFKRRNPALVQSTTLWTGNGSARSIVDNLNHAARSGLVWIKCRSAANQHRLFDNTRGAGNYIVPGGTSIQTYDANTLSLFDTTGFSIGTDSTVNANLATYVAWSFLEAPKFFDIVRYTGNGTSQTLNHNLGCAVGLIVIKRLDTALSTWPSWYSGFGANNYINFDVDGSIQTNANVFSSAPTSTQFSVGSDNTVNASGSSYVAYLFANDTSSRTIIRAGTYTGDGSLPRTLNLGFTNGIRFFMVRGTSGAHADDGMAIFDNVRPSLDDYIVATRQEVENDLGSADIIDNHTTGVTLKSTTFFNRTGITYCYLAVGN